MSLLATIPAPSNGGEKSSRTRLQHVAELQRMGPHSSNGKPALLEGVPSSAERQ